jgi:hypothetical protein
MGLSRETTTLYNHMGQSTSLGTGEKPPTMTTTQWGGDPGDPDEQGLTWQANFAVLNCYEGTKEGVGFHSDHLTSIGPNYCEFTKMKPN